MNWSSRGKKSWKAPYLFGIVNIRSRGPDRGRSWGNWPRLVPVDEGGLCCSRAARGKTVVAVWAHCWQHQRVNCLEPRWRFGELRRISRFISCLSWFNFTFTCFALSRSSWMEYCCGFCHVQSGGRRLTSSLVWSSRSVVWPSGNFCGLRMEIISVVLQLVCYTGSEALLPANCLSLDPWLLL